MSNKFKKIFLGFSIAIPFILYCVYYYAIMIKNAPYKFTEFENVTLKIGHGENYDNVFNSKSQDYQYLNSKDSIVHAKVKLSKDDLLYIHRKAAELGFWNWPEKMLGDTTGKKLHYYLEYDYQRKKKIIEIDGDYNENPKLRDAAIELVRTVEKTINTADDQQN